MIPSAFAPIQTSNVSKPYIYAFKNIHQHQNQMVGDERFDCGIIDFTAAIGFRIKNKFAQFQNHFDNLSLADLGTVINSEYHNFTKSIASIPYLPILIGGSVYDAININNALEGNLSIVTNKISDELNPKSNTTSYIGYQRHLSHKDKLHNLDYEYPNSASLGKIRSDIGLIEPLLRDTTVAYINVNAVRLADVPSVNDALPSGLTMEELCQLMKYLGTASHIKAIVFDTNNIDLTNTKAVELVIAEALWYFLEGVSINQREHPSKDKNYSEYIVTTNNMHYDLKFLSHNMSHKWWLANTDDTGVENYLPVAHREYTETLSGHISDRMIAFLGN